MAVTTAHKAITIGNDITAVDITLGATVTELESDTAIAITGATAGSGVVHTATDVINTESA